MNREKYLPAWSECVGSKMIPSSKKMGRYERQLLRLLTSYFESEGFKVYPHVQLNISWASIISDVDLVAMRDDMLVGVEVKSRRDKFQYAFKQLDKIRDFFDRVYIASDKPKEFLEKNCRDKKIGFLFIKNGKVTEREGELLSTKPRHSTLVMLRKICLLRLAKAVKGNSSGRKSKLAFDILVGMRSKQLKSILKSIVTCERTCETVCPIWNFESRLITPLRNIQIVLERYSTAKDIPSPLIPAEMLEEENNQK